jgi:GT2 family glycosyltransferase
LVSIIIPTRNAHELTERCISSIRQLTSYPCYEIVLVDNGSDDIQSLAYIAELAKQEGVRVLRDEQPFNFSALNNSAVRLARGTVLALVNNDIEVLGADWLARMVSLALQPGAGAVGAKLLYPDGTIQHGGVIMGLGGLAAHAHKRLPRHARGYFGRAALAQNVSAVTAACLVVRKDLYERVGGLNERELAIAYNDIDFCLKLNQLGLRNIWTPFVEMVHDESATRGYETSPAKLERFSREKAYMLKSWRPEIERDPAYSPNLSLEGSDFGLAIPPRQSWPWRPVKVPHSNSE